MWAPMSCLSLSQLEVSLTSISTQMSRAHFPPLIARHLFAFSQSGAHWGANCLVLAPFEGLPSCTEEGAERAPFCESNTFRHMVHNGTTASISRAALLRVEVAFQSASVAPLAQLLGDYEEAAPDRPFCVLTIPLLSLGGSHSDS